MRAFFEELNQESLQKQERIAQRTKKSQSKKTEQPPQKSIKELKKQELVSTQSSSPERTISTESTETVMTSPTITSSPVINSSPQNIPSAEKTIPTSPTIKSAAAIKEKETRPAITENNEYQILQDMKLKWPRSLSAQQLEAIKQHLRKLKKWPQHGLDIKKLSGESHMFRLRVGGYRIIFSVDEKNRIIKIHTVGLRKNVYKKLEL